MLKNIFNIKREELPLSLLMFGYFFLVITSFWILKPIKKSLFIMFYDQNGFDLFNWHMIASQAELIAKVLNMFAAFAAVVVFTALSKKLRRQQLTYIFTGFIAVCYIIYLVSIDNPSSGTIWTFYLFGDLFSTLMVATFFVFLNDSVTPEKAKRLYGLIGLGGVAGGVFGTTFVRINIERYPSSVWLWICLGISGVIVVLAYFAGEIVRKSETGAVNPLSSPKNEKAEAIPPKKGPNPAIEGAKLVFRSKYLISIVGIVGLYEIVSTLLDFQFTSTIAHYLEGAEIGRQFSTMFAITNWVSLLVQLFLTSFIMTRFGLKTALMILPLMAMIGSLAFMAFPVLWVGSFLNTADNGFSYSINQSAKEALYVPTSRDEKYKAKAFIDMFVQRFAKAIAVGVSLTITSIFTHYSSIRWLSGFTAMVIIIWVFAVIYAGNHFRRLTVGK